MKSKDIKVPLRDGVMGAHLAVPERTPAGAIVAIMLHMAMRDRWVQAEVNDLLERRLAPNPLVTIHKYPGADHAFARHVGTTYSKPEADRALELTLDFFKRHLGA